MEQKSKNKNVTNLNYLKNKKTELIKSLLFDCCMSSTYIYIIIFKYFYKKKIK